MLVKFVSSESGELIMFAEVARQILSILGKDCTALGAFTVDEMADAARRLKAAVAAGQAGGGEDEEGNPRPTLSQRAWPLIDMLERTAKGGSKANILWEAARDFGE